MKIRFTKHASIDKFSMLAKHGFPILKKQIKNIILHPDHTEPGNHVDQTIASKSIDDTHEIRVVYRKENDILLVITFYPTQKGRYEN